MKIKYSFFLLFAFLLYSCSAIYENGIELASKAKAEIETIDAPALQELVNAGEDFYLIDVRQPAEYEAGSIPGAFNIPRGILETRILDEQYWENEFMYAPLKENLIVIYCKAEDRGALAVKALMESGFTNVKNLEGGYDAYHLMENE